MIRVPAFVPTPAGDIAVMAHLPDGEIRAPAAMLLHGRASRSRQSILRATAAHLTRAGHPVLSFDYPGGGLTPAEAQPTKRTVVEVGERVASWFVEATGSADLMVVGFCAGARAALSLAPLPATRSVVAISVYVPTDKKTSDAERVVKLARDNGLKFAVAKVRDALKGRRRRTGPVVDRGWSDTADVPEELTVAATEANLTLVFGEQDAFHRRLDDFEAEGVLSPDVRRRIRIAVRDDARLYPQVPEEHHRWVLSRIDEAIGEVHGATSNR